MRKSREYDDEHINYRPYDRRGPPYYDHPRYDERSFPDDRYSRFERQNVDPYSQRSFYGGYDHSARNYDNFSPNQYSTSDYSSKQSENIDSQHSLDYSFLEDDSSSKSNSLDFNSNNDSSQKSTEKSPASEQNTNTEKYYQSDSDPRDRNNYPENFPDNDHNSDRYYDRRRDDRYSDRAYDRYYERDRDRYYDRDRERYSERDRSAGKPESTDCSPLPAYPFSKGRSA